MCRLKRGVGSRTEACLGHGLEPLGSPPMCLFLSIPGKESMRTYSWLTLPQFWAQVPAWPDWQCGARGTRAQRDGH